MSREPLILLSAELIRQQLSNPLQGLTLLNETSSTNDYFNIHSIPDSLHFCLAEHQTQGRGRFARSWIAPYGKNILLSCQWLANIAVNNALKLEGLSLCMGLSVLHAMQQLNINEIRCKWPNDLVYQNQKIAGILIETHRSDPGLLKVIIGIGVNVNLLSSELEKIGRPASSLQMILGAEQDRNHVGALLINAIEKYLVKFERTGFSGFKAEWDEYDTLFNQRISLKLNDYDIITGIARGVNDAGHLLIETFDGKTHAYHAGEVTLSIN